MADVYSNRGLAYAAKSDFDAAIEDYTKALEIDPEFYPNFMFRRGTAYVANGEVELALDDYNTAN